MSLVGPRPALPAEVEYWDDPLTARVRVMPGITGLWQASGRSNTSFEEYKRLDLYYVDKLAPDPLPPHHGEDLRRRRRHSRGEVTPT
jgi:lipopolysaccharide/colanic/teichoic acid biosynthesis glycosyltransferase